MLRSTPLFTAVALITSAIGIGANTTVLSTFGRAPRTRPLLPAGTKLLSGRDFDAHDRHDGHPVAIVNQTAARLLFGGRQSDRSVGLIATSTAGPRDPLTYGVVLLLMIAVALAACWMPASRAIRIDPISALREE